MKKNYFFRYVVVLTTIITLLACKKAKNPTPELTISASSLTFTSDGGSQDITITSNSDWNVNGPSSWLQLSATSGKSGSTVIHVTTLSPNATGATRSDILSINSTSGEEKILTVTQAPTIFPTYNTSPIAPDATGMGSTATQLAANITMGYNIYNTLEATGGETAWGNPVITQSLIDVIKQSGFNAIRLPCDWHNGHLVPNTTTEQIDPAWLARVKQVVQYCANDNMYVMLNIHWDGGWLDCTATGAKQDSINARQKALWEQIATTMRGFDEHLMFASANEPNATDGPTSATLMHYHQTFINAVRSTGGKNTYRTLIIQAPSTSIDLANQYLNNPAKMPVDPTPNKMMIEFHYYTPPTFCILSADASWGKEAYFWGANFHTTNPLFLDRNATFAEEHYADSIFNTVKVNFASKGIPLIMGEFGTAYHADKLKGYPADSLLSVNSVMHFLGYITKKAKANGTLPFVWATDAINRQNNTIGNQRTLDSLKKGAGL